MKKKHLLFVCTGNFDRSPTAQDLFKDSTKYEARSAGTHFRANRHIDQEMIDWADMIFVMSEKENGHLTNLKNNYDLKDKKVIDLDIPDEYFREDPELISLLKKKLAKYHLFK